MPMQGSVTPIDSVVTAVTAGLYGSIRKNECIRNPTLPWYMGSRCTVTTVTIEFMGVTPPVYGGDPPSLVIVGSAMNASKLVLSLQLSATIRQLMVRCIRTIPNYGR